MKRLFGFIAIIIVAIVVCRGLVFAGDSTAVVKGSFNLATMLKNIDIVEILKWVGIVIAGLGGGGVTFWGVIIKIFLNAPNSVVAKIARSNGKWASKWLGQKVNATQEDKLEDTACVYMDNFKLGLKDN